MAVVVVKGRLTAGSGPCQRFVTESGEKFWLVGDLSGLSVGDDVFASGEVLTKSPCGAGRTLVASFIGKKMPMAADPSNSVVRDIAVEATFSPMDLSPKFTLEGQSQVLKRHGNRWKGSYSGVAVTGKLQVVFVSDGAKGQKFTLKVTATDPASHKSKEESFTAIAVKGTATIDDEMVV